MANGWTSEDNEVYREHWEGRTLGEIHADARAAEQKIAGVLNDLYMQTGVIYSVEATVLGVEEINPQTQWSTRYGYLVRLKGAFP